MPRKLLNGLFNSDDSVPNELPWEDNIERLFEMSNVYLKMDDMIDFDSSCRVSLCFAEVNTDQFDEMVSSVKEILMENEKHTVDVTIENDSYGYQWFIVTDNDHQELISSIHFICKYFCENGYHSRLLASLFSFERDETTAYWIYSFNRSAYYPFVPMDSERRNSSLEFKMKSMFTNNLTIEENKKHWHPLWPDAELDI